MNLDQPQPIRVTCSRGLSEHLQAEIEALGFPVNGALPTAIETEGTMHDAMRLNLHLRTAFHVQLELAEFRCDNGEELYDEVNQIPWEELIDTDGYVSVVSRVDTPSVDNSMYPSLKVKDAIVDRITEVHRSRPDSGPLRDRTVVFLLWRGSRARIFLDTSGEKLSDRGYRRVMVKAPMRETLAATLIATTGYTGEGPLVNPMCGSGTLAIEAALIATGRAPGLLRSSFGFKHVLGFDEPGWQNLRGKARQARRDARAPIVATDVDPAAINAARKNAKTAGVDELIRFEICDFADTTIPEGEGGVVILNPPYGKRIGDENDPLVEIYRGIGDFFKKRCQGYTGWVFSGNPDLVKTVGLRSKRKIQFFNGEVECRLLKYELYQGKHKNKEA